MVTNETGLLGDDRPYFTFGNLKCIKHSIKQCFLNYGWGPKMGGVPASGRSLHDNSTSLF